MVYGVHVVWGMANAKNINVLIYSDELVLYIPFNKN